MVFGSNYKQLQDGSLKLKLFRKVFGYPPHIGIRVRAHHTLRNLKPKKGDIILDIGCGPGIYALEIALKGASVFGIDIGVKEINQAIKKIDHLSFKNKPQFCVADACHLPFKNNFFDKIICIDVLEHIENDITTIKEMFRALKKRGIIVLHVPRLYLINYLIKEDTSNFDHFREGYEIGSLSNILEMNGLKIMDTIHTFKLFAGLSWEIHYLSKFRPSIFPLLYPISRLDRFLKGKGRGTLIVAKKRI